jgi:Ca2+-binding RTX toxin-like protein
MLNTTINLDTLSGSNGFSINGIAADDFAGTVSGVGDINGDGINDFIIGANGAAPNGNDGAGQSYVVFGSRSGFGASFDLSTLNGNNGFVINGLGGGDRLGFSVSAAGDVNKDGLDDIIIGARRVDANGNMDAGQSYVIFGSRSFQPVLNPSTLNGTNGFALNGIAANDLSGTAVSGAGDINRDGFDDIIIGAYQANNGAGQSYVVFGRPSFMASLNLSTLNGSNGFTINGIAAGDQLGVSVSAAGDINNDGFDDIIVGASQADPNGIANAGQSYVIFGTSGGLPPFLNPSTLNGSNGFAINGFYQDQQIGFINGVKGAGDVNGDGIDDLIVGVQVDGVTGIESGSGSIVFGKSKRNPFSASINLPAFGASGFQIIGIAAGDRLGAAVGGAGDFNGDGRDDVIIGASGVDVNGKVDAGQTYIISIGPSVTLGSINPSIPIDTTINGFPAISIFTLNGVEIGDGSGFSVSSIGDINGDGLDDVIIGADKANPGGKIGAGQSYVVFGILPGLNLTDPLVDVSDVKTGSATVDLTAGTVVIKGNGNSRTVRKQISGFMDVNGTVFNDTIIGDSGSNHLVGNAGSDRLTGGGGKDRFVFDINTSFDSKVMGVDTITDFKRRQDKIVLDRSTFTTLKKQLSFETVQTKRQAMQSDAQITYIRQTGAIFYNSNGAKRDFGNGGQFADVKDGLNLTARDFVVVR